MNLLTSGIIADCAPHEISNNLKGCRVCHSFLTTNKMIDPEIGFTSDVIRDADRFVGRTELIRDCVKALNAPLGLIAIYGQRGLGKSSLLRQVQQMALGEYALASKAGIAHEVPRRPRTYLTVYYTCDSMISNGEDLLSRLCNDQDDKDGLLRLVPNDGKEIVEFSRSKEVDARADLMVVNWGAKGVEESKYARTVDNDIVQTFRNYVHSIVTHQVKKKMNRDGILIILDEFDVIKDKSGIGSLIKSLSSAEVKFAVCGIGQDLTDLVEDHNSVERLLEEGSLRVQQMQVEESKDIIYTAHKLFKNKMRFNQDVINRIADVSSGYPYFTQLIGKECVHAANTLRKEVVSMEIFDSVMEDIREGKAFPTLESQYKRAIGQSADRQMLLHLMGDQSGESVEIIDQSGRVFLLEARQDARDLDVQNIDQILPRLVDEKYGPILRRESDRQGVYEFVNPVLRLYIKLRKF